MTNESEKLIVDAATGIVEGTLPAGTTTITPEQKQMMREIKERKTKQKLLTKSECGKFFWGLYYPYENYFPNVSDALLSRVIYLMTYLPYEKDYLVVRRDFGVAYRPMLKEDVRKVIGLSERQFRDFWTELLSSGIIMEQDDGRLVVCDRFRRGKMGKKTKKDMSAIKIFDEGVRYVYEHTTTKSHRYLAYLYRLIPYINSAYNVFCSNPEETNRDRIKWLTAKEMCWILGLDDSHEKRVVDTLFKLSFIDRNGDSRSVIKMLQDVKNGETRRFIAINPQFYQGYCITPIEANTLMQEFLLEQDEVKSETFLKTLDKVESL